jgi:hypothetical protein
VESGKDGARVEERGLGGLEVCDYNVWVPCKQLRVNECSIKLLHCANDLLLWEIKSDECSSEV